MEEREKFIRVYKNRWFILLDNFIGGIAWGVGSIIGATLLVGPLGWVLFRTKDVPFWGGLIDSVVEKVDEGRQRISNRDNLD